jgi:hypothetical protein
MNTTVQSVSILRAACKLAGAIRLLPPGDALQVDPVEYGTDPITGAPALAPTNSTLLYSRRLHMNADLGMIQSSLNSESCGKFSQLRDHWLRLHYTPHDCT